jgi:GDP-4-dehydro-6-deoxy-D-mannose reductase
VTRAFITGLNGFVGGFLAAELKEHGFEVSGLPAGVDICDLPSLKEHLRRARPDVVYHLAAFSHVGESWQNPEEALRVNAIGTFEVLRAVAELGLGARVVVASSAEVYGRAPAGELPLREEAPLRPLTPYAASKVAAEFLSLQAFLSEGTPVVVVRPFNHAGPRQSERFVVSAICKRVVEAKREGRRRITAGNLESRRDYTDVRDVVRAYRLLASEGEPGQVYNVCSGRSFAVKEIIEMAATIASWEVEVEVTPHLVRSTDVPELLGSYEKLHRDSGWRPSIGFEDTLRDVIRYWEEELSES